MYFKNNTTLTLGNWQEANQDEGVLVSSSDVIAHVPDREIHGMIFLLASCDRDSRFVASKYGGNKERAVRIGIYGEDVLLVVRLANIHILYKIFLRIVSRPSCPT
jgi:hypothetical protein